jgi:hypothetical protein
MFHPLILFFMIDREIAILQSLTKTVDLCTVKSEDFKDLPFFNTEVINLGKLVADIRKENQVLEISTQGFTNAKNTSKDNLMQVLLPVLKRIQAYASISKNEVLQNAVKLTNSNLLKMQESMLSSTCLAIQATCQDNATELLPYGLTPEMLAALGDAITDFDAKMIGTPKYRGEQKAAKQNMDTYFAQAADIVKSKLDVLAEIIKDTNPQTYIEYRNTRKLDLAGSRTMSLKGKVVLAGTTQPVPGVTVTITKNENGDAKAKAGGSDLQKNVKQSATQGGFQIQSLPAGSYTITAVKEGFTEQTVTVYINDGEMSEVRLEMGKV